MHGRVKGSVASYIRLCREVGRGRLTRREMLKLGLLSGGVMLPGRSRADSVPMVGDIPISPPVTPFKDPLPTPAIHQPTRLDPAPTVAPNLGAGEQRGVERQELLGEDPNSASHQALQAFPPDPATGQYEVHQREGVHVYHSDPPYGDGSYVWGFNGQVPGPTYHAEYGKPILVRNFNDLPLDNHGFGLWQVSTHLHNGHTPSESDGFPGDFFKSSQELGHVSFYDQHYPNVRAGFSQPELYGPGGDPRETMSTLFYHDHRVDFTSQNVYKGLSGFYLLFSPGMDSMEGEEDATPGAFRLPGRIGSGGRFSPREFDVPMIFTDKSFDADGQLFFDLFNLDGILGDRFAVNGVIQPFLDVQRRKYRFRLLNGGIARFYQLFLSLNEPGRNDQRFFQISSDGNLLPRPLLLGRDTPSPSVRLAPAERVDVIVDFSDYPDGTVLYWENRLEQLDGRRPTGKLLRPGTPILQFRVKGARVADPSRVPEQMIPLPERPSNAELEARVASSEIVQRVWRFDRRQGQWAINNTLFDIADVRAHVPRNSEEVWVLENGGGGWWHPIHTHLEEYQAITENGLPVGPGSPEFGRKDVVTLESNEVIKVHFRFRDFVGRYVMHCHNITHEDHSMMIRFDVEPS